MLIIGKTADTDYSLIIGTSLVMKHVVGCQYFVPCPQLPFQSLSINAVRLKLYSSILLGDRGTCVNNLARVITWQ